MISGKALVLDDSIQAASGPFTYFSSRNMTDPPTIADDELLDLVARNGEMD